MAYCERLPVRTVWLALVAAGAALAQIYPPGMPPGYPGGRPYPGSGPTVPGVPMPGRGKKPADTDKGQPLPNFRGTLKNMDSKSITLALDDYRVLEFKRTDKTRFYKAGDEVKDPKFDVGDQISVEGPEDQQGYMTAVNVYWERAAAKVSGESRGETAGSSKDASKETSGDGAAPPVRATEDAPPPARRDADDPGPPVLRRGGPEDAKREHAKPVPQQTAANLPPPATAPTAAAPPAAPSRAATPSGDEVPVPRHFEDDLIRKAAAAAMDFTETLPSYVCREVMARYESESHPANWQPLDVVTANLVYDKGKEDYRDLAINNKPVKKNMEELPGAWSTGEFGTVLVDLLSPATAADFRFRGNERTAGITSKVYDFNVDRAHSHWMIHVASQTYMPAYRGAVWIDPQTARVLRIEMQAYGFPEAFPSDHVESATDYEYIRLGDARQYLLPVHAETLSCQRGSSLCSRNAIDFRNYHKFEGQSTVTFGDVKK